MSKAKDEAVKRSTDPVKKVEKGEKRKLSERFSQWFRDLKAELKKIVWPTRKQTVNNTLISIAFIAVAAVVLWGFDSLASGFVKILIDLV